MKTKLSLLSILALLSIIITDNAFAQNQSNYPLSNHLEKFEVQSILEKDFNSTYYDSNSVKSLLSKNRFSNVNGNTSFNLNNVTQLLLLKDILDLLPSNRQLVNNYKFGSGTGFCCFGEDPCANNSPNNATDYQDQISINYQYGSNSFLNGPSGSWPPTSPAVFDINLKNTCNNITEPIMYVGANKYFGFGTNQPQATYHFLTPDFLVGTEGNFNFRVNNSSGKEHIKFAQGNNVLFLVDNTGKLYAKEFEVALNIAVPDYVFSDNYRLMPLNLVAQYISKNKHLPGIKSADEYQKEGKVNVMELQLKLLEKIEELTLYSIKQQEKIDEQAKQIDALIKSIQSIQNK